MENPVWAPVTDADQPSSTPSSLPSRVSWSGLDLASQQGGDRLSAEIFAIEFANYYVDARAEVDDAKLFADLTSSSFPEAVKTFILQERQGQRDLGTGRHIDDALPAWIRSSGTEDGQWAVELAANAVAPGLDYRAWLKVRVDVVRQDGRWRAADLSTTIDGPGQTRTLNPSDGAAFLSGRGWREIKAR